MVGGAHSGEQYAVQRGLVGTRFHHVAWFAGPAGFEIARYGGEVVEHSTPFDEF